MGWKEIHSLFRDNKMKLTFKDVGQGDSILLEWIDGGVSKIGIIDCNRTLRKNPVLEHIKGTGYRNIEFILLSHPHIDHYSGMVELLTYLEKEKIPIDSFGHTLHLLATDYYKYLDGAEVGTEAKRELESLIDKVDILRKKGIIRKIDFIVEGTSIDITDDVVLNCLSPGSSEASIYMKAVDLEPIKNKTRASQSANHLSTIFKLTIGEKYHLLTSDSETLTFDRLIREKKGYETLMKKELEVCQVPHHGASRNYHPSFWQDIKRISKPQAVVSAGLHETYKHPHLSVLIGFHERGYTIHSTNIVYGMMEFASYLKMLSDATDKLDTFSDFDHSHTGGDKTFDLI
ncbi:MAG TPA: hypothetical protein VGN00_12955 [Puia sp.]|jgi:beta-lactamase superfamily II metal-dependent hydrolase